MNDVNSVKLLQRLNKKREEYRKRKKEIIDVDIQKRIHFAGMIRGYSEVINHIKMLSQKSITRRIKMGLVEQEVPETAPANEEVFPREEVSEGTDQPQPDQPPVTEENTVTEETAR